MSNDGYGNAFQHRDGDGLAYVKDQPPKVPCAVCGFALCNKRHAASGRMDCHPFLDPADLLPEDDA